MKIKHIVSSVLSAIGTQAWHLEARIMRSTGGENKTRQMRRAEYMSFDGYYNVYDALSDAATWIKKQKHISVYDIRTTPPGECSEWRVDVYFHRLGNEVEL